MLPKPPTCIGCPLYGNGKGYVPDSLIPEARLLVLDYRPSKEDERGTEIQSYDGKVPVYTPMSPQAGLGSMGYTVCNTYLPLTGEKRVSFANVLKCRGKGDDIKQAVTHCTAAHLTIPPSVELIVAMGGPAFEFTQPKLVAQLKRNKKGVTKEGYREKGGLILQWRGFLGPEKYHAI